MPGAAAVAALLDHFSRHRHLDHLPRRVRPSLRARSQRRTPFLKTNWLTAIALLAPALRLFAIFRFLRAASALRGFRLVRIVGTANRSMNALRRTLERRKFGYVAVLTLLVVGLGAAGMLSFEPASQVQGGFTSYGDALWWTAMLLTSIGSQYWPVTAEGRVLTVLLSLYGFATFGYITATFASYFVGRDAEKKDGPVAGAGELQQLTKEVRALRAEMNGAGPLPPGPSVLSATARAAPDARPSTPSRDWTRASTEGWS